MIGWMEIVFGASLVTMAVILYRVDRSMAARYRIQKKAMDEADRELKQALNELAQELRHATYKSDK